MTKNGPLRVDIGGPVGLRQNGAGRAPVLREDHNLVVVTNDIHSREDAEFLTRTGALAPERIVGVETGGCPHTAIREDASINLVAVAEMGEFPGLELILNRAATISPRPFTRIGRARDLFIAVSAGDKIPRKGETGIIRSELLVINKIGLAPLVGADFGVMDRDARKMRGVRPFLFSNLKISQGVAEIAAFIVERGGL